MLHKAMRHLEPPASLPKYLAEGLLKQNVDTLRDIRDYVDAFIESWEQTVEPDELPDTAQPVDCDDGGTGTVVKVTCGDETCQCASRCARPVPIPVLP